MSPQKIQSRDQRRVRSLPGGIREKIIDNIFYILLILITLTDLLIFLKASKYHITTHLS